MIHFIEFDERNVVGLHIDGKISDMEFDAVAALLEKRIQEYQRVRVYAEIESFGAIAPRTFIKDLRFGFENLDNFEKEAIVTDKRWLQKIAPAAGALFSDIEIKTFSFNEKQEAREWIRH